MVRYRTRAPGQSPCGETEASTEGHKAVEVLLISFSTCIQPYVQLCTFRIVKAPPHHLFSKVLCIGFHPLQPKKKFFPFEVFNRETLQPTMKMCGHLPQCNHISEEFLIMYGFTFTFWWYLCSVSNKTTSPSKPPPSKDKNLINVLFIKTSSYAWILIFNCPLNLYIKYFLYYAASKLFTSRYVYQFKYYWAVI